MEGERWEARKMSSAAEGQPGDRRIVGGQPKAESDGQTQLTHQAVIDIHQLRVIIVFEDQLSWPHPRFLSEECTCTEMPLQLFERRPNVGVHVEFRGSSSSPRASRSESLNL